MASTKVPIVAIVGRANVGKSSLFNAILDRREAIVAKEAGTTRDSISAKASWTSTEGKDAESQDFWLVDTAGMKAPEDDFELTIQEQIIEAANAADVIWVVIEANVMINDEDRRVARLALKSGKPTFLVINKTDKVKNLEIGPFMRLGIQEMVTTSTTQHQGIDELLNKLVAVIPKASIKLDDGRLRVALLGRPNVGKSALFNSLSMKQQAIVADRAGTTRDINRSNVKYQGREIEIMDTAGIRRPGKIGQGIEHFSVLRSLQAIEQADICFLLMDVNELTVALDQKIAGMVKEAGKGLVLVVSKWDAYEEKEEGVEEKSKGKTPFTRDQLAPKIASNYDFIPWAPLIFTSSVTGQNVTKLFDLALQIDQERKKRIPTAELNRWLRTIVDKHPPAGLKNRAPKLNYMVQEDDNPIPAFKVFGSSTKFVHWSYRRYMDRTLREKFGYEGTPIQIWFIEKHVTHKHGNSPTLAPRKHNSVAGAKKPITRKIRAHKKPTDK